MKFNQKQKVLRHLKSIGSINPLDALKEYSIMRLAAVMIWRKSIFCEIHISKMKYLYAVILLMMSSYILLDMYFDYRLEKRQKEFDEWQKRNQ